MKLPNFYEYAPLNSVKAKMGIPPNVYGSLTVLVDVGRLSELELEKLTSPNGLDISADELTILHDGTLSYKNSRIILYIRDVHDYGNRGEPPKFHLANCKTLQHMREQKRFERYVVSTRTDGRFSLNVISGRVSKTELYDLSVCQNCLNFLRFNDFELNWQKGRRLEFVKAFKINNFFDRYPRSLHQQIPKYDSDNAPLDTYSDDFETISREVKNDSGWRCQRCDVDLSAQDRKQWLHTHHINGLKHDNRRENLEALCIACHAKEPNHGHLKNHPTYSGYSKTKKDSAEHTTVNQLPISKHAQQLLRQAGEKPDPSSLYLLQLMTWAVESNAVSLHPKFQDDLLDFLEILWRLKPKTAYQFLLHSQEHPQEVRLTEEDVLREKDAESLARLLLQALQSAIVAQSRPLVED